MGRKTADGRRALRTGEYQRKSGTFEYKHKDADGRIISISAKTLDELREKEAEALKDRADGIRSSGRRDTLNDWFKVWEQSKAGLKSNTASNYVYMYGLLVRDTLGRRRIVDIKNHDIRIFYKELLARQNILQGAFGEADPQREADGRSDYRSHSKCASSGCRFGL